MDDTERGARWLRFLPLAVLVAGAVAFFALGGRSYLSGDFLLGSRDAALHYVALHPVRAAALFFGTYALIVTLSIPGASVLTLFGGLLFGPLLNTGLVVVSATLGACILFWVAHGSLGAMLRRRVGDRVGAFASGIRSDEAFYMLFMRLAPIFPFWLVNIAAALVGVRLRTFFWTTLVGIVPMTATLSFAGADIDATAARQIQAYDACRATRAAGCKLDLAFHQFITPRLVLVGVLLGLLALAPVALRRLRVHLRDRSERRGETA